MDKKTKMLIQGILGGAGTIASAIVAYIAPAHTVAIIASIGIAETAVNEILNLFTDE